MDVDEHGDPYPGRNLEPESLEDVAAVYAVLALGWGLVLLVALLAVMFS